MARTQQAGRWRDAATLALLAALFTPLTILLHELGHFLPALLSDLPARLHPTTVSGGASRGSGAADWLVALQAGGGPLVTVVMGLAGAMLYGRGRRLWALAFAVAAISRLAVTTAWLGLRLVFLLLGRPYRGTPNFDEYNLALALGVPPLFTAAAATLFFALLLAWLVRRIPRGRRLAWVLVLALVIVAMNFAWPAVAPPVLATAG
jgi:hypothetical protein